MNWPSIEVTESLSTTLSATESAPLFYRDDNSRSGRIINCYLHLSNVGRFVGAWQITMDYILFGKIYVLKREDNYVRDGIYFFCKWIPDKNCSS